MNSQDKQPLPTPFIDKVDKIQKNPMKVVIHTQDSVIIGEIYVRPRNRLVDEMIGGDEFFAVTNAEIYEKASTNRVRASLLVVNKDHIVMVIPWDAMERNP